MPEERLAIKNNGKKVDRQIADANLGLSGIDFRPAGAQGAGRVGEIAVVVHKSEAVLLNNWYF
jgi:hypothetical protein